MEKLDLFELQKSLTTENIITLVIGLGADRYEEKENYLIFPTICHNENSEDASMKLYYYKNTGLFTCYTDCGESFNIYTLIEKVYALQGKEIRFSEIVNLVLEKSEIDSSLFQFGEKRYKSIADKYRKKNRQELVNIHNKQMF